MDKTRLENAEKMLATVSEFTNRKLRLTYEKGYKGYKIEEQQPDGKYMSVFGFGCGNTLRDIHNKIYGFWSAVTLDHMHMLYK